MRFDTRNDDDRWKRTISHHELRFTVGLSKHSHSYLCASFRTSCVSIYLGLSILILLISLRDLDIELPNMTGDCNLTRAEYVKESFDLLNADIFAVEGTPI